MSPSEIVATFPAAKMTVKELMNECELWLEEYRQNEQTVREHLSSKVPMYNIEIASKLVMIQRYGNAKEIWEEKLRVLRRYWSLYNPKKTSDGSITDADIIKAKEYPIRELVDVKRGNARCVWHTPDKNPSMHIYPDNHVYCFSCGKGGDVIAIYQTLNNCDFVTAVRALI